jgi:hypothetical protein
MCTCLVWTCVFFLCGIVLIATGNVTQGVVVIVIALLLMGIIIHFGEQEQNI